MFFYRVWNKKAGFVLRVCADETFWPRTTKREGEREQAPRQPLPTPV